MRRRKSSTLNVLGTSAIDLFASAMGVFMVLSIIMAPFFLNTEKVRELISSMQEQIEMLTSENDATAAENERLQENIEEAQADIVEAQAEIESVQAELEQAHAELGKSIEKEKQLGEEVDELEAKLAGARPNVFVAITWPENNNGSSEVDVDLHVVDARGTHIWHETRSDSGQGSELTVDSRNVGAEVFVDTTPDDGEYIICYHYYIDLNERENRGRWVAVKGFIFYNDKVELENVRIKQTQSVEVARLVVKGREGKVVRSRGGKMCPFDVYRN